MKSNTNQFEGKENALILEEWSQVEQKLGLELEGSARRHKALQRRRRIRNASDLLRLVLVYCVADWSLELMGIWAVLQQISYLSDVAILKRVRQCRSWVGELLYTCLRQRGMEWAGQPGVSVRLRDASVINAPGSQGTAWRVHLKLDLAHHLISGVEVTDAHGGESLARLPIEVDEIQVGDRGYAFASGIGAVLAQKAHVVVRINYQNLPLWSDGGQKFASIDWLGQLQEAGEQPVWLETPQGRFALRLIACPLPPRAAEAARRRTRQAAIHKKRTPGQDTLRAAGFVLLITDLPQSAWPLQWILWLYRLRWQIELQFKTYKSLLHFDQLRSKDPELAQTYLLGKLLIVLLLEQLTHQFQQQQPDWFANPNLPVSNWVLTACLAEHLRLLLIGNLSLAHFWTTLPALQRYFRRPPRSRPQQLAWAQVWLISLASRFSHSGA